MFGAIPQATCFHTVSGYCAVKQPLSGTGVRAMATRQFWCRSSVSGVAACADAAEQMLPRIPAATIFSFELVVPTTNAPLSFVPIDVRTFGRAERARSEVFSLVGDLPRRTCDSFA